MVDFYGFWVSYTVNFQEDFRLKTKMDCGLKHQIISQLPAIDECMMKKGSEKYGYIYTLINMYLTLTYFCVICFFLFVLLFFSFFLLLSQWRLLLNYNGQKFLLYAFFCVLFTSCSTIDFPIRISFNLGNYYVFTYFSCSHYQRRCKIIAPCCNEIFDCRHCHNDAKVHFSFVICLVMCRLTGHFYN